MEQKDPRRTSSLVPSNKPTRRMFLTGLAMGAGVAPLTSLFRQSAHAGAAAAATDLCYSASKPLLGLHDFTYLGYYDIQTAGNATTYAQGLTCRYVNGDLRLLNKQYDGTLHEISLANQAYGSVISNTTNRWSGMGGLMDFTNIWWDEPKQRLWSVAAIDYTVDVIPTQIYTRTLNTNGTVSNVRGPISLSGIPAKRVYGGAFEFPSWFRSQYGVQQYAVGFGGYTSLMLQGGNISLGPAMYAVPDPASYSSGSTLSTSEFRTLLDFAPPNQYRGTRLTLPLNYFDGGGGTGAQQTGSNTRPTYPPLSSGSWLSPAADGTGWWTWGDHYEGAMFIDGTTKAGIVMLASVGMGATWYANSTLNYDNRAVELHVYDPAQVGAVAQGKTAITGVKPAAMGVLSQIVEPAGSIHFTGNGPNFAPAYDSVGKRLYVLSFGTGITGYHNRLHVYSVNA